MATYAIERASRPDVDIDALPCKAIKATICPHRIYRD